jgi:hypothetical protein
MVFKKRDKNIYVHIFFNFNKSCFLPFNMPILRDVDTDRDFFKSYIHIRLL